MSRLGVRYRLAAVSLAVAGSVVVLSGCSGSDAAQSQSETVSLSPSPSATYKPASAEGPAENVPLPVMPEEAKVESKEGLIAFARYWYELANYGYETGDVEPLRAVSGPDCFACGSYYSTVDSGYQQGWISGGIIEALDFQSTFAETDTGRVQVLTQFVQDPLDIYNPSGHVKTIQGNDLPSVQMMEAVHSDGQWAALDVVTIYESP